MPQIKDMVTVNVTCPRKPEKSSACTGLNATAGEGTAPLNLLTTEADSRDVSCIG